MHHPRHGEEPRRERRHDAPGGWRCPQGARRVGRVQAMQVVLRLLRRLYADEHRRQIQRLHYKAKGRHVRARAEARARAERAAGGGQDRHPEPGHDRPAGEQSRRSRRRHGLRRRAHTHRPVRFHLQNGEHEPGPWRAVEARAVVCAVGCSAHFCPEDDGEDPGDNLP